MNTARCFGERLRELVFDSGLRLEEISSLSGVGLSRLRYWLSPSCANLPCTRNLIKLSDFFDCSVLYMLGLEEENSLHSPNKKLPDFGARLTLLMKRHEIKLYILKRTGRLSAVSSFFNWTSRGSLPDVYICLHWRRFSTAHRIFFWAERIENRGLSVCGAGRCKTFFARCRGGRRKFRRMFFRFFRLPTKRANTGVCKP